MKIKIGLKKRNIPEKDVPWKTAPRPASRRTPAAGSLMEPPLTCDPCVETRQTRKVSGCLPGVFLGFRVAGRRQRLRACARESAAAKSSMLVTFAPL